MLIDVQALVHYAAYHNPFSQKTCQFTLFGRHSVLMCIDMGKPQASTLIDCLIATDHETNCNCKQLLDQYEQLCFI